VILFSQVGEKTGSDIWSLAAAGDSTPTAVVQTPFDEDEAQFSPDGHWIAYRSNESGRPEVYIRPYTGPGNPQTVSTTGGSDPRWRRDGKELFYVSADRKLTAVPISMSSSPPRLTIGAPVPLFPTRMIIVGLPKPQYSVARDGQHFWMNVTADEVSPSIAVVQNWTAAAR
jgi:dipeptidyl aminopeptidase/acylaminoacyl peptidase